MRWFAIPLLVALQAGVISAAATQSWELSTYGEFLAGTFKNIALDREGVVRVAPSLDVLHDSEQAVVWSLARAEDGSVYYGTGHQGAVFRVAPAPTQSCMPAPRHGARSTRSPPTETRPSFSTLGRSTSGRSPLTSKGACWWAPAVAARSIA